MSNLVDSQDEIIPDFVSWLSDGELILSPEWVTAVLDGERRVVGYIVADPNNPKSIQNRKGFRS